MQVRKYELTLALISQRTAAVAKTALSHRHRVPWRVLRNDALYVYTEADSWKVKRIRNNPRVRVAVCNVRGKVKGPWLDATASIVEGDERLAADRLLDRKYFLKKLFNFLTRINRHKRAMIKIEPSK